MTAGLNIDRARAWLDALPRYETRHGVAMLVSEHDGDRRYCAVGVCAETARLGGAPLTIRAVPLDWPSDGHVLDYVDTRTGRNDPYGPLHAWLGVDLLHIRVVLAALPGWLRERIAARLDADHLERPYAPHWRDYGDGGVDGLAIYLLSDARVPFDLIADALRVTLDVDPERVPGTVAHGLCVAQEAAEGGPWSDGNPEPAVALTAAGAR